MQATVFANDVIVYDDEVIFLSLQAGWAAVQQRVCLRACDGRVKSFVQPEKG
jgi:hypothetical protein